MAKAKPRRTKHVPQRTCVGCREVLPKRSLIRLVRTPEGVKVDPTGKMRGRGAYLHNQRSCWERALKGALAQALRTELSANEREYLLAFMTTLPEEETPLQPPTGSRDPGAPAG
ncbi:YlxR family protein [uncultured Thermanaerothrix sp.]|uniref:YlxR family protein n=1 Tax=uncultured Thermanaerothrix sp. TaxID=1195149 RepID=UPI00261091BE|nr:YlxR family protein [uncultured Thermanaerothrix sp.]